MARIPDDVIEQIKTDTSLVRLVEHVGIELKKQGKDLAGKCPFHDDDTPSLIISEVKNVFHCFGCDASGTVIDWVMKIEGVSFRHAVELLQNDLPALSDKPKLVKHSSRKQLEPFAVSDDDQALLNQVIDYYHETLLQNQDALAYCEKRGLGDRELIERFKLGFANRTLAYRLPEKHNKAGREVRGQLQTIGILRESGHEHLTGSIIVPIFDDNNNVVQAYGRKIMHPSQIRKGSSEHLYLPGPHRGVFNHHCLKDHDEIILCESLIDALTFYHAGYKNVTCSYGVNGFTDHHLASFKKNNIKRVLIAYDCDEAGNTAADKLTEQLLKNNMGCYRIQFPKGMDANEYALQVQPASKSLGVVIRGAKWLGSGKGNVITTKTDSSEAKELPGKQRFEQQLKTVVNQVKVIDKAKLVNQVKHVGDAVKVNDVAAHPAQVELDQPREVEADIAEHEITLTFGDRRYRVRGFGKNLSYEVLRVNLLISCKERIHVDTFDIYSARHRQTFIKQACAELELEEGVIKNDIGKVLLKLELLQEEKIQQTLQPDKALVELSDADTQEALTLLKSPDLLNRIIADVERCGLVGEKNNSLAGYLACVSRKLDGPLAIIVQSTSAAGKSSLMDAVLAMMPEEERVQYSAMTGQSLFYMGETNLKHKILAIAEEEGAAQASYALKLLQSEGELTIASTAKDPQSGRLETQEYRVEGPVMLFLTTTAIEIDDELLNRCLVLTVNEDREQTKAIHQLQRKKRTLDGLLQKQDKKTILQLHQNAQRLLKPLHVVNPFAEQLTFLDDKTRTRRDHEKYLTLIDSIALLHQYQRKTHSVTHDNERIDYIEVTLDDIAIANELAHDILGRTLDELPPQTRRLLKLIYAMVQDECKQQSILQSDVRFSRKQIRDYSGWGDTQLKIHLHRLEELEYLLPHRGGRGQSFIYELLHQGESEQGESLLYGLIDIKTLGYDKKKSGLNEELSGSSRPQVGAKSASSRGKKKAKSNGTSSTYAESASLAAKSIKPAEKNNRIVTPSTS